MASLAGTGMAHKMVANQKIYFHLFGGGGKFGYVPGRATKENATPQLEFRRALAMKMLNNKIMDDGMLNGLPMRKKRRSRASDLVEHELCTRPPNTGIWKTATNAWSKIGARYAKTKCHGCKTKIRTYCKCNKKIPLCTECYGKHILEVNNTF